MGEEKSKPSCIHEQVGIYNFDCHDCFQRLYMAQKELETLRLERERLREALEKIEVQRMPELSDDFLERSMQLAALWTSLKMIAHEALASTEAPERKPREKDGKGEK